MGGSVIPINEVRHSSVTKGESLPATIRTPESYTDANVIVHRSGRCGDDQAWGSADGHRPRRRREQDDNTGGPNLTLFEANEAAHPEVKIIFGVVIDGTTEDKIPKRKYELAQLLLV